MATTLPVKRLGDVVEADTTIAARMRFHAPEPQSTPLPLATYLGEARRNARQAGVEADGVTDDTAAIKRMLESGWSKWAFPPELIAIKRPAPFPAGAASGGVLAYVTNDLDIEAYGAEFFTDDLDASMINITVPAGGAGVPTDGLQFAWRGGRFNQRNQRNSNVVPQSGAFPPINPGSANGTDALRVRLFSDKIGGGYNSHGRLGILEEAEFIAGDHWETAGGDSNFFAGAGMARWQVRRNLFQAARDLGVYFSGIDTDADAVTVLLEGNTFRYCFFGSSFKRGHSMSTVRGNRYIGNVIGHTDTLFFVRCENSVIAGNYFEGNNYTVRLDAARYVTVGPNRVKSVGAYRADGTTPLTTYGRGHVQMNGTRDCIVRGERGGTVNPGHGSVRLVTLQDMGMTGSSPGVLPDQTGMTSSQITVTATLATSFADMMVGSEVLIESGAAAGQRRVISAFTAPVATVSSAWDAQPATGDTFRLFYPCADNRIEDCQSSGYSAVVEETAGNRTERTVTINCVNDGTIRAPILRSPTSFNVPAGSTQPHAPLPLTNKHYPTHEGNTGSTAIVAAQNVLYLYPFFLEHPVLVEQIFCQVRTVGSGSTMKVAWWRNLGSRPTGLPVIGSNTAASCDTANSRPVFIPPAPVRLDAGRYWGGSVFTATTTLPIMTHVAGNNGFIGKMVGADSTLNALFSAVCGLSTPFPFTGDIMALDLTSATWTAVVETAGVPVHAYTVD